mmetsp:Transcript_141929/g.353735  ORF Transcript_141929/g.353735 Transcript_141929/m.353735 type:complete len:255 (+) Transcript_141929:958-1722(+)
MTLLMASCNLAGNLRNSSRIASIALSGVLIIASTISSALRCTAPPTLVATAPGTAIAESAASFAAEPTRLAAAPAAEPTPLATLLAAAEPSRKGACAMSEAVSATLACTNCVVRPKASSGSRLTDIVALSTCRRKDSAASRRASSARCLTASARRPGKAATCCCADAAASWAVFRKALCNSSANCFPGATDSDDSATGAGGGGFFTSGCGDGETAGGALDASAFNSAANFSASADVTVSSVAFGSSSVASSGFS